MANQELDNYKDLKIVSFSFGKILLSSMIPATSGSYLIFFKLEEISLELRIIIVLSIFLLAFFIDLMLLFVREREITYEVRYLKKTNNLLKEQVNRLGDEVSKNNENIKLLDGIANNFNKLNSQ